MEKFDDSGLNLADPHDTLGHKSRYISMVQQQALRELVGAGSGLALDVGCGTGRMTQFLSTLGYQTVGLDPSARLLRQARQQYPGGYWCTAALPLLPFQDVSIHQIFLINVLRPLHLLNRKDDSREVARVLAPAGRLVVLDNIAPGKPDHVEHKWIVQHFTSLGLELESETPIRFSHRLTTYLIRYGLIPERYFSQIAARELSQAKKISIESIRRGYMNVIYLFRKSVD